MEVVVVDSGSPSQFLRSPSKSSRMACVLPCRESRIVRWWGGQSEEGSKSGYRFLSLRLVERLHVSH